MNPIIIFRSLAPKRARTHNLVALVILLPLAVLGGGVVTTPTEANLRAAMAGGGTVTFACDGTITLTSTITNETNTTVDGSGHEVTISGANAVRVFQISTNIRFTVVSLAIANGQSRGGSAILNLGGIVNLTGVSFRENVAASFDSKDYLTMRARGGAILNRGGTVTARNCSFTGNGSWSPTALGDGQPTCGGAIRNEAGQLELRSCTFAGNWADGGSGGQYPFGSLAAGEPGFGGAIHSSGTVSLDLCTFSGNSAYGGSGSGRIQSYPGFSGGEGSGGAIFNEGNLAVERTTLGGNIARGGSGGEGGPPSGYPDSLNGFAGGGGGGANGAAICNVGSCWVVCSTLASNVATGGSGGAGADGMDASIGPSGGRGGSGGNAGSGLGGALFNSGAASLVNCTIASNIGGGGGAGRGGAGKWGKYSGGSGGDGGNGGSGFGGVEGTCDLTNCTLAWNRGSGGSGGAGGSGGSSPGQTGAPGASGTTGSAWGGPACGPLPNTLIASNTPAGGDSFSDPNLGPLADNGGPTLTMALLAGSPAIDAGDTSAAPPTDQRGVPRPFGAAADIGAYEYATLLSISRASASGLDILFRDGNPGQTCRLLTSTTLSNWTCVATNQVGTNGMFLFRQNCNTAEPERFYKAVLP